MNDMNAEKIGLFVQHNYGTININPLPSFSSNIHRGLEAKLKTDGFIAFHKETVGREAEIAKIDNFLRENKSGYFIITGKAGFGKSALLAKWIRQRLDQNSVNYEQRIFLAYHYFSREFSVTSNLEAGYTNLLRQLYIHRKEDFPVEIYGLRDKIVEIIQDLQPSENEQWVIVIDALDEADDTIDPFIQHLPEGVFVIVSARADKNENPPYLKNWSALIKADGSNSLFLEEIDKNSIKNLLSVERLNKYQLDGESEIVDLIYRKTGGFPLYLRYLIEEINEALESGKTKESVRTLLENTPKEFGTYIEKQFNELCESLPNDWQDEVESLLSIMSVALGALSEQDVKKLTSLKGTKLRGLPPKLRRWVRITGDEEGNNFFSFDHDLVREVFATKIFDDEKDDALEQLLAYCADWQKNSSRYALRHYPEHLYRKQSWNVLYELAQNEEFQKTQEQTFPFESDVGLRTLQTALQAAIVTDDAPKMAEFTLKHARKVLSLIDQSPLEALEVSLEKAISQTELIYKNDEESGILWFLLLANRLNRNGRIQDVNQVLTSLQTHSPLPKVGDKDREQLAIFFLCELSNDEDRAHFVLQNSLFTDHSNSDSDNKLSSSENKEFSNRKKLELTESVITSILDESFPGEALSKIAEAQAKVGYFESARLTFALAEQIVRENDDLFDRIQALRKIAQAQAGAGQSEQALLTEQSIVVQYKLWTDIFTKIAKDQAKAGQIEQARKTAQKITDERYAPLLIAIAESQANAGYFEQAEQTAQVIYFDFQRREALSKVAEAQAKAGHFEPALQTARIIHNYGLRTELLIKIAEAQIQAGKIEQAEQTFAYAIETAQAIEGKYSRAGALSKIAEAQAKSGYHENAPQTFAHAKQTAQYITDVEERSEALSAIAKALAEAGYFINALQTAQKIFIDHQRSKALGAIAEAQAKAGQVEQSLQTLKEVASDFEDRIELSDVAEAQIKAGYLEHALQTAREIGPDYERDYVLVEIAKVQAKSGCFEKALQTAQEITDYNRDQALSKIAEEQTKAGQLAQAFQTFKEIYDQRACVTALRLFAEAQAKTGQAEQAEQTFAQVIKATKMSDSADYKYDEALSKVAEAQARAGYFEHALQTAQNEPRGFYVPGARFLICTSLLIRIAEVQANAGHFEPAEQTFARAKQKIIEFKENCREKDAHFGSEALRRIAQTQAKTGQLSLALQTAQEIKNEYSRVETLSKIAEAQGKAGCYENAEQTCAHGKKIVQEIFLNDERHAAMVKTVESNVKAGKIYLAERTISEIIRNYEYGSILLSAIAEAEAKAGYFERAQQTFAQALQTAQRIGADHNRSHALGKIAEAQIETGYLEQAVQTAKAIDSDSGRAELSKIAGGQAQAGYFEQAKQTAQRIRHYKEHCEALGRIAAAQTEAGYLEQAEQTFAQAKKTAQGINDEHVRGEALTEIAKAQAQTEYSETVLQTAQLILHNKNEFFPQIAAACVAKGNKELFKAFLPPTAYYLDSAYLMIGLMAHLYSADSVKIAQILTDSSFNQTGLWLDKTVEPTN